MTSILGPYELNQVYHADCLEGLRKMPSDCIDIAITSPPYWGQRGDEGIGLEEDPRTYVDNLVEIFLEVMRVLKPKGVFWLNMGDSYNTPINWRLDDREYSTLGPNGNGLAPHNMAYTKNRGSRRAFIEKESGWLQYGNLLALPWRIIIKLCDAGMFYRGEVIWHKRKALPEGRCRRPHRRHESIYLIAKNEDHNFRVKPPVPSVWDLKLDPGQSKNHTSTFPLSLPVTCIEASGLEEGVVLDPFMGSGTTGVAANLKGFDYIGFELDPGNIETIQQKICRLMTANSQTTLDFTEESVSP